MNKILEIWPWFSWGLEENANWDSVTHIFVESIPFFGGVLHLDRHPHTRQSKETGLKFSRFQLTEIVITKHAAMVR